MPKKTERGDPLGFLNIHSVAKHQEKCRGTLWGKKSEKCLAVPRKNERGDPLVLPGMVCYAKNRENLFGLVR